MSNPLHTDLEELLDQDLTESEAETVLARRRIKDLHSEGRTPREIAAVLNLSTQRIYQALKQLGLAPNQPKGPVT